MKILVTSTSFRETEEPLKLLEKEGYQIIFNERGRPLNEDELKEAIKGMDGVIAGVDKFTASVIESADCLKVISRYGAGIDNIDLKAAKSKGIVVTNTPGANTEAVADLTLTFMLALSRNLVSAVISTREGKWGKFTGWSIENRTLGILGLGKIGKSVARRAIKFSMKVIAYDLYKDENFARENNIEFVSLEELFKKSDYISLHLLLTEETKNIVNRKRLELMKSTAFLINTARGELIDEDALYEALFKKRIAGAAVDVFKKEPPIGNPLLTLENFLPTSHIAAHTKEAMLNMGVWACENLIDALKGKKPKYIV